MKRLYTKGETPEERLNHLERRLQTGSAIAMATAQTVIVPPIPLSLAVREIPADGEVFRGMIGVDGHLGRGMAICDRVDSNFFPYLEVKVVSPSGDVRAMAIKLGQKLSRVDVNLPIEAGSKVVMGVSEPHAVAGLWACVLFESDITTAAREQVVVDHLLDRAQRILEDANKKEE